MYADDIIADGAVAYWPLSASAGTFVDVIAGNVGTGNAGFTRTSVNAINEQNGRSILLNGSTGYISVPGDASLPAGDTFSVECWVQLLAGNDGGIREFVNQGSNGFSLRRTAAGFLALSKQGSVAIVTSRQRLVADGLWHHIAATKSAAAAHALYMDGADVSVEVGDQTISAPGTGVLAFGRTQSTGTSFFKGYIAHVAVYKTVLPADRIASRAAYRIPSPVTYEERDLRAYLQAEAARIGVSDCG